MKLNIKSWALTCGMVWGMMVFTLTWWIIAFDGISSDPVFLSRLYRGYAITPAGSIIGLLWAFADGLIIGAVFAWLYNTLNSKS